MEVVQSLSQVIYLLLVTGLALLALEVFLYIFLFKYEQKYFWPFVLISSLGVAGFAHLSSVSISYTSLGLGLFWGLAAVFKYLVKGRLGFAIMMLAPAFLAISLIIIYPFFFEVRLAFANLNLYTIGDWLHHDKLGWAGFQNFLNVFVARPLQTATFWQLLGRTFLWTFINLVFHVGFGLFFAMLLNKSIGGRGIYRTLLILPWAIPQVVAILAWRGEFHPQFGFINHLLATVGISPVNWWTDPIPVFISCCIVNIWLGIPFMMIVFLGGLQSIPRSLYEAASIDGASKVTQFFQVTLPMLKPVVVPSVTLGTIWTFNNINVIYLMTGQDGGNEYADILVSALYKSAFTYSRYSFSAAFALVIFVILLILTIFWMKITKGTESAV